MSSGNKNLRELDQMRERIFKEQYEIHGDQNPSLVADVVNNNTLAQYSQSRMIPRGIVTTATRAQRGIPNSLPMLPAEPTMRHTFRFRRADTASLYRVDLQDLYQVVVAASAPNYVRPIFRTFRVLNVVVRGSINAVGETATVSLRYEGTNTNQQKYMDSTNKVDVNAMVHRKPPPYSLASFWHDVRELDSAQVLFEVEYFGTGECYLDIQLQAVLDCNGDVNFSIPIGASNTSGRLYSAPIGSYPSGGGFDPVGILKPP
jgi:hypothetical protein